MLKNILIFIILVLVIFFNISFLSEFTWWQQNVNSILIIAMVLLLAMRLRQYLVWISIVGLIADTYSGFGFGAITLSLILTSLIAYILYVNYFSHHTSLVLVILMAIQVLTYGLLLAAFTRLFYFIGFNAFYIQINSEYIFFIARQIIFSCFIFVILYVFFNRLFSNFRERFIINR
ncbi:MAG: hypothetical protein PHH01_03935 [Patescibacteria group bacterium]|nr:hypothetical protein [Patescibacteria group bacterium]